MVDHRQGERATHAALVFTDEEWDDEGNYIGTEPIGEVTVHFSAGGEGWVQTETGQQVHRNPTLDWPVAQSELAVKGRELHLRQIDATASAPDEPEPEPEYVIENTIPVYGRYRTLDKLDVAISSI